MTEIIAASGREVPFDTNFQFTRTLTNVLLHGAPRGALSVTMLYNEILSRLTWTSDRLGERNLLTPIYVILNNDGRKRSITLSPLQEHIIQEVDVQSESAKIQTSRPQVQISLALEDSGQGLSTQDWFQWLRSMPSIVETVEVQGVYSSN